MLMRAPRTLRMAASGSERRSSPLKTIFPLVLACGGSRRMMANDVADFPEPDSPTRPNVPDSGMVKLTSRTAATSPLCVAKVTFRCSTWRRGGTELQDNDLRSLRADLIRRQPRLHALVHGSDKGRFFLQQRISRGGKFAFQTNQALC